ncbi:MAG: DUF6320 domain-containing protein [Oscillospiraceae bacterium]|nr:DUF6320 domain-containing protein [Oscillospiraceae bacterium]
MRCCKRCDVNILSEQKACPLCHDPIDGCSALRRADEGNAPYYPKYTKPKRRLMSLLRRSFAFASLAVGLICTMLDLLTGLHGWSMIVAAGLAAAWLTADFDAFRRSWLMAVVRTSLVGMFMAFIVDMLDFYPGWSLSWVMPWTLIGLATLLVVFICINPTRLYDSAMYLLLMTAIALGLMACGLVGVFAPVWPAYIAAVYLVLVMAWFALFGKRSMRGEIVKRLHI